jgi:aminomethyltransferase
MFKSPLHDFFAASGALFEERAGYAVAQQTAAGIDAEAEMIRGSIGIWDHSDMAKLRIAGNGSRELLDRTVTGDIDGLPENSIRYTLILNKSGRIVSDVQVYNNFDEFLLTCTALKKGEVLDALNAANSDGVTIEDVTAKYAAICMEGPEAWRIPSALADLDIRSLRLLTFEQVTVAGAASLLSRIGYCGEYGYILLIPTDAAAEGLRQILEQTPEAKLCGRAVQDLLRLEVRSFNLMKDVPKGESPLQAGLHWMINFQKPEFPGRDAILAERDNGLARKLVAFECAAPVRHNHLDVVRDESDPIGYIVNYDWSERRGKTIGLAYLNDPYGWPGLDLLAETPGGPVPIRTVSAPFIQAASNRVQVS